MKRLSVLLSTAAFATLLSSASQVHAVEVAQSTKPEPTAEKSFAKKKDEKDRGKGNGKPQKFQGHGGGDGPQEGKAKRGKHERQDQKHNGKHDERPSGIPKSGKKASKENSSAKVPPPKVETTVPAKVEQPRDAGQRVKRPPGPNVPRPQGTHGGSHGSSEKKSQKPTAPEAKQPRESGSMPHANGKPAPSPLVRPSPQPRDRKNADKSVNHNKKTDFSKDAERKVAPPPASPGKPRPGETERGRWSSGKRPTQPEARNLDDLKAKRRERTEAGGKRVIIEEPDRRRIIREGGRSIIRHDETERFRRIAPETRMERRDGLNILVALLPGGIRIYTELDDEGRPLRRYRRGPDGRDIVLFDNRHYYRRARPGSFLDAIIDLPAPRLSIPRERYIVEYDQASEEDIYDTLDAPPVDEIEQGYSLEEVRRSPSLRDRMRRIDLNAINFDFGSWTVAYSQYGALERLARAMNRIINRNPAEMFLIEGHTDAVGSEEDNLSLSDRRAEAVAIILTDEFGVPPENLITQGYGEQYLKVVTELPERLNRRVAVRRITPLLAR